MIQKQIKLCVQLLVLVICLTQNITKAQPLRIDVTTGLKAGTDLLNVVGEGFGYGTLGNMINTKISYMTHSFVFSPVFDMNYYFPIIGLPNANDVNAVVLSSNGFMVDLGIEKSFAIGYSKLNASIGIGYNWETYNVDIPHNAPVTFANNDIIYWSELSLYLPFVKGLDVTLGYRLIFKKKQILKKQVDYIFQLETANTNHLLMAGISFSFMDKKKKK